MDPTPHTSRTRLLDAALQVIRTKGYAATTVEDVCAAAGLTKGSFFHHFKGKEELALAAAKASCAPEANWDPETLAYYTQAVIQGAFVLAKAQGDARMAVLCIHQLRTHLETPLPPQPPTQPKRRART